MKKVKVQFEKLSAEVELPVYQTEFSSGMDVRAFIPEALVLNQGEIKLIKTGFKMAVPPGFETQVRPRSGLALKHGITLPNSPGTIDADYRGEVGIILQNTGKNPFTIEPGMRIAQLVIQEVIRGEIEVCKSLDETNRGTGGFGSTGK
jgi:dUTP pyrophosphatase